MTPICKIKKNGKIGKSNVFKYRISWLYWCVQFFEILPLNFLFNEVYYGIYEFYSKHIEKKLFKFKVGKKEKITMYIDSF